MPGERFTNLSAPRIRLIGRDEEFVAVRGLAVAPGAASLRRRARAGSDRV